MPSKIPPTPATIERPVSPRAFESSWGSRSSAGILLLVLVVVAYLPALRAGFIWDDDLYVEGNTTLRTLSGLWQIWFETSASPQYYPLTFSTFWAEYQMWGPHPLGYHLVNVVLHGLNALLLWQILLRLRLPAAWLAAALFALHPIQVESVAWITERKNVLSGLFAFAAVLVYQQRVSIEHAKHPTRIPWAGYLATYALFVAALLSKSVTCTLPAVLLAISWWQCGRIDWRRVSMLIPMAALSIAFAVVTVQVEEGYVTALGSDWDLPLLQRVIVAGRIWWFYPAKLVWPYPLIFNYPRWSIDSQEWWQSLFALAALGMVGILYLARDRLGRGPLAAVLLYTITLAPTLGFFNVFAMRYSFVVDHFAYLPSVAWIVLGTSAVADLLTRIRFVDILSYRLDSVVAGSILIALSLLTAHQCEMYRDLPTLWTWTLARNPQSWMAHTNLAVHLLRQDTNGDANRDTSRNDVDPVGEAIFHLQQAVKMKPNYPEPYYNLAIAHVKSGKLDAAVESYEHAIRLRPDYLEALMGLANALVQLDRTSEALRHYEQVLRLKPDSPDAYLRLGEAALRAGEIDKGIGYLQQLLRMHPDLLEAHHKLASAWISAKQPERAVEQFRQLLQRRPNDAEAHNDLGSALLEAGNLPEAIREYEQALRIDSNLAEAHGNLGIAYLKSGQREKAIDHFREALSRNPNSADLHNGLAVALTESGNLDDAILHFEEATRLAPQDASMRDNLEEVRGMKRNATNRNGE